MARTEEYDIATEAIISMEVWCDNTFDRWLEVKQTGDLSDLGVILNEKGKIVITTKRTAESRKHPAAWYIERHEGDSKLVKEISSEIIDLFMAAYHHETGLHCMHVRGYDILDLRGPERSCVKHRSIAAKAKELATLVKVEQMADSIGTVEAAQILGVTQLRVNQLIGLGSLPAYKVSDVWVLSKADVEKFAKRERKAGRPKKTEDVDYFLAVNATNEEE